MGYPGDQGKPGDWPPRQPPHAPYGPGAGAPPYGHDNDEAPFAPRERVDDDTAAWNDAPTASWDERPAASWDEQPAAPWDDRPVAGGAFGADDSYGPPEGMPPGPPGPPGPSGGGPTPPERRRNLPLIIGGSAVAGILLIGGGVGLSSLLKDDDAEPAKAAPTQPEPTQAQPEPSPAEPVLAPVKLKTRTTDPKPLTLKEVFGKAKFTAGDHKYVRTAVSAKKGCTGVVGGTTLEKALKKGDCTQALRATYALTSGSLIGTVGVFNLESESAAKAAVKAAGNKDAFLQALPGKGVSKTNGKGEAFGTSQARGHYVIMTWVQRPDGKKIASKYHAAVQVFGTQMVKGSNLALALHYRETEGKPLQK
ncbi:hypothetical protein ACGFJT_02555 [Actinomadura geliboluensis]|uniref:hypothetical protein n=1 Tax=Actinomadura geliboluensis TaxID=882440 RepID=UPI00371F3A62